MRRKIHILLLATLLATLLLAACGGPSGTEITGADRDAVLKYADPMTDNLLQGMAANDYGAFSRDFDQKMLESVSEKQFGDLKAKLDSSLGAYQSRVISQVIDYGEVVTVIYKGTFAKTSANIQIAFAKNEPHKIAGLYFR